MPMITIDVEHPPVVVRASHRVFASEAARYLLASVAALTLDTAMLFVGARGFGLPAWFAGGIAYGAGLSLIYWLSIRWVFADRTLHDGRSEFIVFAVLGIIGLVLNSATLLVATGLGLSLPLAKLVSAGIGVVANFISRKWFLFSKTTA